MKITHRVTLNANEIQRRELLDLGIKYKDEGFGLIVFVIDEKAPSWPRIANTMLQWKAVDLPSTTFSRQELSEASYLRMGPAWNQGYPQPENGYEKITYDDKEYCGVCHIGLRQRGPFRLLQEPNWGSKQILQLNWIVDEFFVTPDAWECVFKQFGIEALPVLDHKKERPLSTVVQLQISSNTIKKINPDGFEIDRCQACNRVRLLGISLGRFPHVELPCGVHIGKTLEYFGTTSWHEIIVSADLYRAIVARQLKGVTFDVVAAPGQLRR